MKRSTSIISASLAAFVVFTPFVVVDMFSHAAEHGDTLEVTLLPAAEPAIEMDKLVRINEQPFAITHDATVSLEATSVAYVRKIGYGFETEVRVVTTATGVYSTDGLASPHLLYPGISVQAVAPPEGDVPSFTTLDEAAWAGVPLNAWPSFIVQAPAAPSRALVRRACAFGPDFADCV